MATVGPDKRLAYYQQSTDTVLAELTTHHDGLTEPEAARRLEQHGLNALDHTASAEPLRLIGRQLTSWPVLSLFLAAGLSGMLSGIDTAGCFVAVALLVAMARTWQAARPYTLDYNISALLPATTVVSRGSMQKSVSRSHLVVGDIVHLRAGDAVPADLRLLETDDLIIDESILYGSHGHSHKHHHTLMGYTALAERHNMAWLGSAVRSGSTTGIVVATGLHTELGRLLTLSRTALATRRDDVAPVSRRVVWLTGLGLLAVLISIISGRLTSQLGLVLLVLLLTAASRPGAALLDALVTGRALRRLSRRGVHLQAAALQQAARFDIALLDIPDFFQQADHTVHSFIIGKQVYGTSGQPYAPTGRLIGPQGTRLIKKQIREHELFFAAAALSSTAQLLPADAEHASWHPSGSPAAAAVVTLAARAGIDIAAVRAESPTIQTFPVDSHRQAGALLRRYGTRTYAFVQGDAGALLTRSARIWDGGHTRAIGATERDRIMQTLHGHTSAGRQVIALCYRAFSKPAADTAGPADIAADLTLLGLVVLEQAYHNAAPLHELLMAGIRVHFLTPAERQLAALAQQYDLHGLVEVSNTDVDHLTETQLGDLLEGWPVIWTGLTAENRLRLVDIARRYGHRVLASGRSLQDVPALCHAAAGLASTEMPAAIRDQAIIRIPHYDLGTLLASRRLSRQFAVMAERLWAAARVDAAAVIWLILLSFCLDVIWHIPFLLTMLPTLVFLSVLQLIGYGSFSPTGKRRMSYHQAPVGYGAVAALLALANFYGFFARSGLRPAYIAVNNPLAQQAATLSLVTLIGCLLVNGYFAIGRWPRVRRWLIVYALIVAVGLYLPALNTLAGTRPLGILDWLCAVAAAAVYFGIRWLLRNSQHHRRQAVIQLHHEVHGKGAGAKI